VFCHRLSKHGRDGNANAEKAMKIASAPCIQAATASKPGTLIVETNRAGQVVAIGANLSIDPAMRRRELKQLQPQFIAYGDRLPDGSSAFLTSLAGLDELVAPYTDLGGTLGSIVALASASGGLASAIESQDKDGIWAAALHVGASAFDALDSTAIFSQHPGFHTFVTAIKLADSGYQLVVTTRDDPLAPKALGQPVKHAL
jgi:hypothetical protein